MSGTVTVGNLVLSGWRCKQGSDSKTLVLDVDCSSGKRSEFVDEVVVSGGSCDVAENCVRLKSNGVNGSAVYQSREYIGPHAGGSVVSFVCGNMNESSSSEATGSSRVGFFYSHYSKTQDSTGCGVFLECVGDELFVVKRTHTSGSQQIDERIAQANWNVNVLDGTGNLRNQI